MTGHSDLAGSALVSAIGWLQETLLGGVAISFAVIAIATIGLLMLTGRIDVRRGARVILGCFIIFGASAIAAGLQAALFAAADETSAEQIDPTTYPRVAPIAQSLPANNDPYAGAAVPRR